MAQELSPERLRELIPAAALARVPGAAAPGASAARVTPLEGGTLHRSFRVQTGAGEFVLRMHDAGAGALGADHAREAHLQNAAAAVGIAPRVIYLDPAQRFLIAEYLSGRLWTAADMGNRERLHELGAMFRALHGVTAPIEAPFDLGGILRDFAARISAAGVAERLIVARLMEGAERSLHGCASDERPSALVHNDPHHANLIDAGGLCLIDFEYAAVADPLFDIACVLAYYPHAEPYAQSLLEASGLKDSVSLPMLNHAIRLYVLLSFFWFRARRLESPANAADQAVENALLARLL